MNQYIIFPIVIIGISLYWFGLSRLSPAQLSYVRIAMCLMLAALFWFSDVDSKISAKGLMLVIAATAIVNELQSMRKRQLAGKQLEVNRS